MIPSKHSSSWSPEAKTPQESTVMIPLWSFQPANPWLPESEEETLHSLDLKIPQQSRNIYTHLTEVSAKVQHNVLSTRITNDSKNPCQYYPINCLHMLKRFVVLSGGLELKIESSGAPPQGGGEVVLAVSIVQSSLFVITFSTRVSSQFENNESCSSWSVCFSIFICTDHKAGPRAGNTNSVMPHPAALAPKSVHLSSGLAIPSLCSMSARDYEVHHLLFHFHCCLKCMDRQRFKPRPTNYSSSFDSIASNFLPAISVCFLTFNTLIALLRMQAFNGNPMMAVLLLFYYGLLSFYCCLKIFEQLPKQFKELFKKWCLKDGSWILLTMINFSVAFRFAPFLHLVAAGFLFAMATLSSVCGFYFLFIHGEKKCSSDEKMKSLRYFSSLPLLKVSQKKIKFLESTSPLEKV
ncbi:hypothetical protein HHK36_029735 [Tetracentron sinense]|uniref:Uncharacterized protein n=1 Tax=Tetracentron sinense TaxID=13715 RepID=A0A834YA42_TETSI|nr:hypothetical protein HHK36_029735 [Tetracentron sinense]